MLAPLSCIGSHEVEVPPCSPVAQRPTPDAACGATREFADYREALTTELARALSWQIPELPTSVELDPESRVERVCAAPEAASLPWKIRRRLVESTASLRSLDPGPACAAGTRIDLQASLAGLGRALAESRVQNLGSCLSLRRSICIEQDAPVCGVFADGTYRTYRNACQACESSSIRGWMEGPCPF